MKTAILFVAAATLGLSTLQALAADSPATRVPANVREACVADVQKLCAGIQPGKGRLLRCLKEREDAVSDKCKEALKASRPAGAK